MSLQYQKVKSVAKQMLSRGPNLQSLVLKTLKTCSDLVGATLGPGGMSVVIERQEINLPPVVTKDGVTVFRSLGFDDAAAQVLMEAARDASVRTAAEAGDGPQPMWSKVLTPNGFVTMSDVVPGMTICGTNGSLQKVEAVYDKGEREIFEVEFTEGRVVECSADHLWSVTTHYGVVKTLPLSEIRRDFRALQSDSSYKYKYFTPRSEVEFHEQGLTLDPYLLGVLLGDGSLSDSGSIELSLGLKKEHIIKKLVLPDGCATTVTYDENKHSFRVKLNGGCIREWLEEIGLRNTDSFSKFIPDIYLMSSTEDRRALLQGLIDTDGHINTRGRFEFSTVSKSLADDFIFLCRSLGKNLYVKVHTRENDPDSYSDTPIYRIYELKGDRFGNKIVDVRPTGRRTEMRCIKVSNPDHLYITDGFITTHNTTTATILAEALVRKTQEFCEKNPHISPQRVVRTMQFLYQNRLEPGLKSISRLADFSTEEGRKLLHGVARISANGDSELADAVIECFDITGDNGNVTIVDANGPSEYIVNKIKGYPAAIGYEDCCSAFFPEFINDSGTQQCVLEKPVWILYHGYIADYNQLYPIMELVAQMASDNLCSPNVVVAATGFSETVIANMAASFKTPGAIRPYPLKAPLTAVKTGQYDFLLDLSALTGTHVLDPITAPLGGVQRIEDFGTGPTSFEAGRFRSNIVGFRDAILVEERVMEIEKQLEGVELSEYDRTLLKERIAMLSSGIARLIVQGSSNGEVKERRDRAEDAVCAVRGALKHGVLPGGGAGLCYLSEVMKAEVNNLENGPDKELLASVAAEILAPALQVPVIRLFSNAGYNSDEINTFLARINPFKEVYDLTALKWVPAWESVYDSLPAVRDALKNSISIASLLGTCGGTVVFKRDGDLERSEARDTAEFLRATTYNEANERP